MEIVNIVCSGKFNGQINLERLVELGSDIYQYDPENYHGGYIILNEGKVTIYHTGKYIIVGLKSLYSVESAFSRLKEILKNYLDTSSAEYPKISNIVAKDDIGMEINLNKIVSNRTIEDIGYEPEQFPGLIFKTKNGTGIVFSSGKFIFTGAKSQESLEQGIKKIRNFLLKNG